MTHREDLLDPVESAIEAIAAGRPVLVVDDADRENEGDIIFAADAATPELMGLTVRLGSGNAGTSPSKPPEGNAVNLMPRRSERPESATGGGPERLRAPPRAMSITPQRPRAASVMPAASRLGRISHG